MRLPLNALRTFEAVARRLSFSKGAQDLHVSPAAVSSQIRSLEHRLGQPLFNRRGRSVSLTEAGRKLLPGVQRGLAEITQAVSALEENREGGMLSVSMLPSFLQKWLTPRLSDFYARHGNIDLRINTDFAPINFFETDFHAAIRFGSGHWPGLTATKLFDEWSLPVCTPETLARIGPIDNLADLTNYPLIYSKYEPWDPWIKSLGGSSPRPPGPAFDDSVSVITAAEEGLGIGLVRWSLVSAELASGRLVRASSLTVKNEWAHYFVAPPHYFIMPKVAVFRAWLEECSEAFPAPDADDDQIG